MARCHASVKMLWIWESKPKARTASHSPPSNHTPWQVDRKSTRLNSSHVESSYAVFCLKKKRFEMIDFAPASGTYRGFEVPEVLKHARSRTDEIDSSAGVRGDGRLVAAAGGFRCVVLTI